MFKKPFILSSRDIKHRCMDFIEELPEHTTFKVMITEYKVPKSREQEEKYHAQIGDIAPHFDFMGRKDWHADDVKRILIDAFARIKRDEGKPLHQNVRVVPSLDGTGVVNLDPRSREFTSEEASEFIEFLNAYGAELNVPWSQ